MMNKKAGTKVKISERSLNSVQSPVTMLNFTNSDISKVNFDHHLDVIAIATYAIIIYTHLLGRASPCENNSEICLLA